MVVAIASLVTIFNSFSAYNKQVNSASNSNAQVAATSLSVTGGQFGAYPPVSPSNPDVATGCPASSTSPTSQPKVFYASNMWWDFFTCSGAFQYSTSFDGATWQGPTTIPAVITAGFTVGPYFDVVVAGSTLYLAIAEVGSPAFQLGVGTLMQGGSYSAPAGTIGWSSAPALVATTASAAGPIETVVDGSGNQWVAVVQGTCTTATNCAIGVYEHEACAAASSAGWEPNPCASAANPTNYAPATLGALSANAQTMEFPAISSYSTTGVILLYETGSATAASTGTLGLVTQTTLASASWSTFSLSGITDYSLTASSSVLVGNTVYFAGLENAAVGQTTGPLRFWSVGFNSMTAGANTPEMTIEATTRAWQAALTYAGGTLALFDSPAPSTVQYYTSSTLGTTWNSPAITLVSAETGVNGLAPASGRFAVTWTDGGGNVRVAALSSFTLSNDSPFAVHVVDLYIYEPSTNALVAHYYYNSTEDFDYWVGQGGSAAIPVRFVWSANTTYLVTFGTDTGVTAQLTLTTPPGGVVACPSGSFFSQLSPTTQCAPTPGSTSPFLISGSGADTCTDTTGGTPQMMDLGLSYTTTPISSGSLYVSFSFQVASATGSSGAATTWQVYYGSGTAPACGAAVSGTAIGQAYTVNSQSNTIRALSQSEGVAISGLAPNSTYWFDASATDSSGAGWTYSNPDLAILDVQTTEQPDLTTSTNANACTDTTGGAVRMPGFATTFTTGGAGFTGDVYGKLTFNVAGAATSGISTAYQIAYGTGTPPACNSGAAGTAYGNTYTITSQAGVPSGAGQNAGFVLTGLSPSTTYWVDLRVTDSSGAAWVYSNPVLATMEMPAAGGDQLPSLGTDTFPTTCTVTTANTYKMGGFGLTYNVPSDAAGDLYVTLTFQVTTPGTNNVYSQWQADWGTGGSPACNTLGTGTTAGNTYTVYSQSGTSGAFSQSETFVLTDVQKVAGAAIWVDVQAYDSSGASWRYSNAEVSVAELPGPG